MAKKLVPKPRNGGPPRAARDASGRLRPGANAQSVDFYSQPMPAWTPEMELGATGLIQYSGIVREELLPKLQGILAIRIFKEMADNDPVVGASLASIDLIVRRTGWRVEAAGPDQEDRAAADFLTSIKEDMAHTWTDHVSEAMTMLQFGWSYFEIVYKVRNGPSRDPHLNSRFSDGKIGVRKLAIRAQDSLFRWLFDGQGGIQALVQNPPPDYWQRTIPIDKALLYRVAQRKNNPESRSILRTAYRPWWFKKRIEEIQAIGIERDLAGVPVALVPPQLLSVNASTADASLLATIKKIVTNIRNDEQAGIVFPLLYDAQGHELYKLSLMTTGGRRQFDTVAVVNYYDERITLAMLTDFMLLGQGRTGSFALAESKISNFSNSMGAYLDSIEEVLNRYLVPRLFELNGWDLENLPKFRHEPVESVDLANLGDFINKVAGAGMQIFPSKTGEVEDYILRAAHLPHNPDEPQGSGAIEPGEPAIAQ